MSGDLVSLRMLVVTDVPSQRDLWQQAAVMSSVPIDYVAEGAAGAVAVLQGGGIDVCVIDGAVAAADRRRICDAARAARPAPLVFAAIGRGKPRPDNVDGALARPSRLDDARKLVEICVRAKMPTRVLVVDDSSTTRSIVRKMLSASRFALEVHEASEGLAALEQLASGRFDLVFLDYNMPGLNGFETLYEIKRIAPATSVAMMTATVNDAVIARAQASGALAFLKKPFFPADIDAVFARYFGLHALVG